MGGPYWHARESGRDATATAGMMEVEISTSTSRGAASARALPEWQSPYQLFFAFLAHFSGSFANLAKYSVETVKKYIISMVLPAEWYEWAKAAGRWFESNGAASKAAEKFALLWGLASVYGYSPRITSIWRDPKRQAELRARWDAGDRAGLLGKPALKSKHTETTWLGNPASLAMDMPSNNIPAVDKIARNLGLGAGSDFTATDPGHYYLA